MVLAALVLFALTRAEIVQRMRAPVITQADGLVRVFASCDEDLRRECQGPVAGFAAETVRTLWRGLGEKPVHFSSPGIVVVLGNGRTNDTSVVTRAETNDTGVVTRIRLPSPAFSDTDRFRTAVVQGFFRAVKKSELSDDEAAAAYRRADPRLRVAEERATLERWLAGATKPPESGFVFEDALFEETEKMFLLHRKVLEPGVASRRDVLTFASRLRIYSRTLDERFVGGANVLTFREAIALAPKDPRVRVLAFYKTKEMAIYGAGRTAELRDAAVAYQDFLFALVRGEKDGRELTEMLDAADALLRRAEEKAI